MFSRLRVQTQTGRAWSDKGVGQVWARPRVVPRGPVGKAATIAAGRSGRCQSSAEVQPPAAAHRQNEYENKGLLPELA